MTEAEEDLAYFRWIAADGPARTTREHKAMALDSLERMPADGITVLAWRMRREAFEEISKVEAVIDCAGARYTIRWNSFNRGWMVRGDFGGWIIAAFIGKQRPASPPILAVSF